MKGEYVSRFVDEVGVHETKKNLHELVCGDLPQYRKPTNNEIKDLFFSKNEFYFGEDYIIEPKVVGNLSGTARPSAVFNEMLNIEKQNISSRKILDPDEYLPDSFEESINVADETVDEVAEKIKEAFAKADAAFDEYKGPYISATFIDQKYNLLSSDPEYLFNEGEAIKSVKAHIDATYFGHYSGKYQATSVIIDAGHGTGFNIGNIIKYAKRYGKKDGYNQADLYKIIHYAIMQLYVHEKENLSNGE